MILIHVFLSRDWPILAQSEMVAFIVSCLCAQSSSRDGICFKAPYCFALERLVNVSELWKGY